MAGKLTREEKIGKFGGLVNKIYHNTAPLLMGEAAVFIIMAILMMLKPVEVLSVITFAIGAFLILFGLYRISMVFVSNLGLGVGSFDVFFGLVTLILGFVFCIYPGGATVGIVYVFIVMFLLSALKMLFFAINMARVGFGHYFADLITAIVMICLSLLLLFIPNLAMGIIVWCLAVYLLLYAAADVYMFLKLFQLRRLVRK
ncbi:MAG: DUF308 domain-containing protein [Alphaproteobacteria bacterium]|nr:DUF308 domain-containing protein [Alphaproteobacteria bacterium]